MPYNDDIANTILDSFKDNLVGSKEKYSVGFHELLQSELDVNDTVEKLIEEKKIVASVSKLGQSIIVTDDRS